jgi:AraC-like DNA-binding protein
MGAIALTRATILLPVISYLGRNEAPIDRLLDRAHLPRWVMTRPEGLVPTVSAPRLMAEAARTLGITDIGIRSGEAAPIETLGTFGRLIRRSRTLGEAVEATIRHHPSYSSNGRMWLVDRGDDVEFCQAFVSRWDADWAPASHYILTLMIQIVRLAAGPAWRPAEVSLQTQESRALRDHPLFAGAAVRFSQASTAVVFPKSLMTQSIRAADDPSPADDLDGWSARGPRRDFAGALDQIVATLTWDACPSIADVADTVGITVRTLQRRLAAEGSSYEKLVDAWRFRTATRLLMSTDVNVLDVALECGYSDHAHFTRAFRRWSGCSPTEFRRRRGVPLERDTAANARILWERRGLRPGSVAS